MTKTLRSFLFTGLLALLSAASAVAQAPLYNTTLSAAVAPSSNGSFTSQTITVAAVPTGIAVGWEVYADREAMLVTSVNSTVLGVLRGYDGTMGVYGHNSGQTVYIGPTSSFQQTVPYGACTAAQIAILPFVVTQDGSLVNCTNGQWVSNKTTPSNAPSQYPRTVISSLTGAVAAAFNPNMGVIAQSSTGYVVQPTDYIIAIGTSGTTPGGFSVSVQTVTLPVANAYLGRQLIIKDESGALTGTTYILLSGTIEGVASGTINGAAAGFKLNSAGFPGVTLYAGSGGWFVVSCSTGLTGCTLHP